MNTEPLEIKVAIQIHKTEPEVFESIVNPDRMSGYFISKGSGRMEEGKILTWHFPEFEEGFPVEVGKIEPDKTICFYWEHSNEKMTVEIILTPVQGGSTLVTVTEKSKKNNPEGIEWLKGNTEGWANFLACLKAYLEYGINLRKGAFDFLKNKK
jgi:uncharacterized protein YndB with AHSA1/START domain